MDLKAKLQEPLRVFAPRTPDSSSKQKSLPAYSPARSSYFFPAHEVRNDEAAASYHLSPTRPPPPMPDLALPPVEASTTSSCFPSAAQTGPPEQDTRTMTGNAYVEMHDMPPQQGHNPLSHLAVSEWARDKRDASRRAWAVKVLLGLCIGVLAAAVVALSIVLSTEHCSGNAPSGAQAGQGQSAAAAAYTSTVSTCTTLTETRGEGSTAMATATVTTTASRGMATVTATATATTTVVQTTASSAGAGRPTTVTETKIRYSSSVSTKTVTTTTALTSYICTSSSSSESTKRLEHTSTSPHPSSSRTSSSSAPSTSSGAASNKLDCTAGLPCSSPGSVDNDGSSTDASGRAILQAHPDCEDVLVAALVAGAATWNSDGQHALVNASNTRAVNATVVSGCMFECMGADDARFPGQVMYLTCCEWGLDAEGTHCAHSA